MKTSKTDFQLFKDECQKWIKFWGLLNWDIVYNLEPIEGGNLAETSIKMFDHIATIVLNKDVKTDIDRIKRASFHEIEELRFARLRELANTRFMNPNDIQEAIHEIIVQNENCIFQTYKS